MVQDGLRHAPKRPKGSDTIAPRALGAPKDPPLEANIIQKRNVFLCVLPSRPFASDGHLGLQDCPREPQDGPRTVPGAPKSAPRCDFKGSRGGADIGGPPSFDRCSPRWPQDAFQGLQEGPRKAQTPAQFTPESRSRCPKGASSLASAPGPGTYSFLASEEHRTTEEVASYPYTYSTWYSQ